MHRWRGLEAAMRILLVDDDTLLRQSITRRLRAHGANVDPASGVEEALKLAANNDYGLVISDEHMPDGFGHALLEAVADRHPTCRRVLMSAREAPNDVDVVWERFFMKPDDITDLVVWSVSQSQRGGT
jgi:DNA-binding NtrC family response regulator